MKEHIKDPLRACCYEYTVGRETFKRRLVTGQNGWRQDDTQAAFLGLTDVARDFVSMRASEKNGQSRFHAFWGPNFDWIPDQDHGGNLMKAFQTMLLQADHDDILLMPAWPTEWDVSFKLHAPQNTILKPVIENGRVVSLDVTPKHRCADVILLAKEPSN